VGRPGLYETPGSAPRRIIETRNFDEWLETVAADRGIGICPDVVMRRSTHPAVRFIPLRGAPPSPVSLAFLPLAAPVSDAKVLTGRQRPLTEIAFLFAEVRAESGYEGVGYSYAKRAGGPGQYAHAREIAPALIGEDPSDIQRIWTKLVWAGASVGRSGLATQAIAAFDIALWDLKAKRARLPLAKLLGAHRDAVACYNTSGGFLSTPVEQVVENADSAE